MAARPCADRLSLERVRLRADRNRSRWRRAASLVGLWGLTFIAVAVFASAGGADRRAARHAAAAGSPAPALRRCSSRWATYGMVRLARTPTQFVDQCEAAHHAAEPAAGRQVQLFGQGGEVMSSYLALSDRATGPQNSTGGARSQAS